MKGKTMPKEMTFLDEEGNEFKFQIHEQVEDTSDMEPFLTSEWCQCGPDSEFLCYPKDGCCTCGTHKHHVHCKKCGGISQIG